MSSERPSHDAMRARVLDEVGDFGPAKPLRAARVLVPALVLIAAGGVVYFARFYAAGLRGDREALGALGFWGLSALQVGVAAALLVLVLREIVPGRRPSLLALGLGSLAGLACHAGTLYASNALSPTALPATMDAGAIALYCLKREIWLALPALVVLLAIAARGLPTSPVRLALLGGVGATLIGDAVWRLVCPVSDPDHVLRGHSPAFLATVAAALVVTLLWDRLRRRRVGS